MDIDQQWLKAEIQTPYHILGLRLKPLCIDHLVTLEFLDVLPAVSAEQLITAVQVLSRYSTDYFADLESGKIRKEVLAIRKQMLEKDFDLLGKFNLLKQYFEEYQTRVDTITDETTEEGMRGSPWLLHLKVFLMNQLRYDELTARRMPYNRAVLEYYATLEMKGRLEIVGKAHEEALRHADSIPQEFIERVHHGS